MMVQNLKKKGTVANFRFPNEKGRMLEYSFLKSRFQAKTKLIILNDVSMEWG